MMKAVIIEDELQVAESLSKLIHAFCDEIKVCGIARTAEQGIQLIEDVAPDLVFLDILMPRQDGFHVLERFKPDYGFKCIFTTAHEEFAIKAIKYNALDYLLKPIDPDELKQLEDKLRKQLKVKDGKNDYNRRVDSLLNCAENRRIALPTTQGIDWLKVSEIIQIQAGGNYCTIWLQPGTKLVVTRRLKYFEEHLDPDQFIRVHKSYMVNLLKIKGYTRSYGGMLIMENGCEIPVSEKHKPFVLQLIGIA